MLSGLWRLKYSAFRGAEEAFNRRVVEAVALAAHALLDSASHERRSVALHLVVPTLVGMHDLCWSTRWRAWHW